MISEAQYKLLVALFSDLQQIDKTSILPDGDWVSVRVALWAGKWVEKMQQVGLIDDTPTEEVK